MVLHFLDTSALLKNYIVELGTAWVENLVASEPIAVSYFVVVEVSSSLARRIREGSLTPAYAAQILQRLDTDLASFTMENVTRAIVRSAGSIIRRLPPEVPVRAGDAIHLATVQRVDTRSRRRHAGAVVLVTSDRGLIRAAQSLGFAVEDPEGHA